MSIKIFYRSRLFRYWPLKHYGAIVLGRSIFTRYSQGELDPQILAHELVHLEQMQRHGILGFYSIYLFHYCKNLCKYRNHWRAYREIPFEREAYRRQNPPK